jgi:hypothetical protein
MFRVMPPKAVHRIGCLVLSRRIEKYLPVASLGCKVAFDQIGCPAAIALDRGGDEPASAHTGNTGGNRVQSFSLPAALITQISLWRRGNSVVCDLPRISSGLTKGDRR